MARASPRERPEGLVAVESEGQIYRTYPNAEGRSTWHGTEVIDHGHVVHLVLRAHGATALELALEATGPTLVRRRPASGRGFERAWRAGTPSRFAHFVDGAREGLEQVLGPDGAQVVSEARYRAGRRHGAQRRYADDGHLASETLFEDGFVAPVTRPRVDHASETRVSFTGEGEVHYTAPEEVVARIRRGMSVQRVADLLGVPVSAAMGVHFVVVCGSGVWVRFARGRVVSIQPAEALESCVGLDF